MSKNNGDTGRKLRPCDYPRLDTVKRAYLIFELVATDKPTVFVAQKFGISVRQVQKYAQRLKMECRSKQLHIDLISYDKNGNLKSWL